MIDFNVELDVYYWSVVIVAVVMIGMGWWWGRFYIDNVIEVMFYMGCVRVKWDWNKSGYLKVSRELLLKAWLLLDSSQKKSPLYILLLTYFIFSFAFSTFLRQLSISISNPNIFQIFCPNCTLFLVNSRISLSTSLSFYYTLSCSFNLAKAYLGKCPKYYFYVWFFMFYSCINLFWFSNNLREYSYSYFYSSCLPYEANSASMF